jgi:pilus assembly protein Flp/PilA
MRTTQEAPTVAQALKAYIQSFRGSESGQGLVEYSLILALVSIATIAMLTALGTDVGAVFTFISGQLP